MPNLVIIGGESIDAADPCAIVGALERVRLTVASGGAVEVTRFGEDEVRFTPADLGRLDRLIADYRGKCEDVSRPSRRRRYAMKFRY